MSSSLALRQARHLSTAATSATTTTTTTTTTITTPTSISISKAKYKLKSEHDPDKALEIYSSVSDHYATSLSTGYTQNFTVKRLAKANRFDDIENFLESHKKDPNIIQEHFLSSLIRSYSVAGMFDHALKTYNDMEELGTPRSSLSFNALLSACVRGKKFGDVVKVFDEMPQRNGFVPDSVSYGILIKAYCEMGDVGLAIERLREMEGKGVDISSIHYTTILHCLYVKGMVEEAEKVWNEMLEKGYTDVGAYNVRIMNVPGGDVECVKGLIEEMGNDGLKPDAISYNYLMTSYCKREMLDEAKKVYDDLEINKCKPNAATFRTLIFYLCKKGRYVIAHKVFKQSVEAHKIPDFDTLKILVEGLVKKSKMKEAKGMIRTIKKKFPPTVVKAWEKIQQELGIVIADEDDNKKRVMELRKM
ncbi:hypothetical protein LIER_23572 [Lithospermum erythrorhizon]|uniref:Pentatricopeptide repeat-containing protein n=1 Tax=Lithospermum erythrorhizon TaxID=34254 RepID=A0AAV3QXZ7_LITER